MRRALIAAVVALAAAAPAAQAQDVRRIPGLQRPVTIDIDRWGVPHIFARTTNDVFLAQGFNAARDRLFQIDLWRRRGLGRLSEALGPRYAEQDRAARLFLYRGDIDAEWDAYGPDTERIATQFTRGVNAYIDWVQRHPSALPPEFTRLGYAPERWRPEDVVRIRTHALVSGLDDEVTRARLACAGGLDLDPLRTRLEPGHEVKLPDGLDPCLPEDVLDVYELATRSVSFGEPEGSNNWTVSGARTTTGRPILANDPHRAQQSPSLRYIAHLSAPGLNVIGAGEPALPGISIGHNQSIAFGLTVFGIDAQDLYVYELDAANERYRYRDGWEPLETVRERIAVRGAGPRDVELQHTRHGPVIHVDAAKHRAYAVRSTWSQPGTSAYFASIAYMRARNWTEFLSAMARWGTPGENQVYADVEGNIGWKAGGLALRRRGYDGLLPVPGDGRYEWDGFIPSARLPQVFNPPQGFFATANQFNLAPGTPPEDVTAYEWSGPDRHRRIVDVLSGDGEHSPADSARLQTDVISPRAQALLEMLAPLRSEDALTAEALRLMAAWDGAERLGSPQATLFERYWQSRLNAAVKAALVPAARRSLFGSVDWLVVMDVLRDSPARDELLLSSLRAAYAAAQADLGADTSAWGYTGNARSMPHPLGTIDPSLNVGPFAIPGSGTTPIASGSASYRQVIDVGRWDRSLAINTPGQSGVPGSEHYRDLAPTWSRGGYFPLLYSRAAVERHTERRVILVPGG